VVRDHDVVADHNKVITSGTADDLDKYRPEAAGNAVPSAADGDTEATKVTLATGFAFKRGATHCTGALVVVKIGETRTLEEDCGGRVGLIVCG